MVDEVRVVVIDNYPLFRKGVVQAIRRAKGMTVVAEGATAEAAEQLTRARKPDVLLIESAVPGSLAGAQAILHAHPDVKVVFLAAIEDDDHATRAMHAGAHGYIMKGITGRELIKAIKAVHIGERYITFELAWRLVTQPKNAALPAPRESVDRPHLSIREQQVLDHTSRGLTNKEIANLLGLGLSTIKHYKTLAFRKMGVRNRLEAIVALQGDESAGPELA